MIPDSKKRVARTAYQVVVALVAAIPVFLGLLPPDVSTTAAVATTGAIVVAVANAINWAEDKGILPAWLKGDK